MSEELIGNGKRRASRLLSYWNTFWFMSGVSLVSGLVEPWIGYRTVGFLFLLAVMVVGMLSTVGPTFCAALASALVWNYFFIPPRLTLLMSDPADVILCLAYLMVTVTMGYLTNRIRAHERILREREDRTHALFEVSQDIALSRDKNEFLPRINARIARLLDGECGVILRAADGELALDERKGYSPQRQLSGDERAAAAWAFCHEMAAGWCTDTLAEAKALYIPLKGPRQCVGVLVFEPHAKLELTMEQENLLHAMASQLAVSLERDFLEGRLRETEKLEMSEKLHQTLLNSISHEMRTPLTTILGGAAALDDKNRAADPRFVRIVAAELLDAGDRLNHVIENLLDMSRLNSGVLALQPEWHEVGDLVGVVLNKLAKRLAGHRARTDVPRDLPLVQIDFRLMEHALFNLLLNATAYSPPGTSVDVRVRQVNETVELSVQDQGPGIPENLLAKVLEKFFRIPGTPTGGIGLGLSIVKSITEAHHGEVRVENVPQGGARFTLVLPLGKAPPGPEEPSPRGTT